MPNVLESLSEAAGAWLTQEEQALSKLARRRDDAAVHERLRIWKERLHAYERFEAARAAHRATASSPEPLRSGVPQAVENGLRLVS